MQFKRMPHQLMGAIVLLLFVFSLDFLLKEWIISLYISGKLPLKIFPGLKILYVLNRGVSFGVFNNSPLSVFWFITGGISVLLFFLAKWMLEAQRTPRMIAYALIIGGGLGNLCDRVLRGAVIDFIDLYWGKYHWPAFNLADASIVCGVVLIIYCNFKEIK